MRQSCPLNMEAEKENESNSVVEPVNPAVDDNSAESNVQQNETAVLPNGKGSNETAHGTDVSTGVAILISPKVGSILKSFEVIPRRIL